MNGTVSREHREHIRWSDMGDHQVCSMLLRTLCCLCWVFETWDIGHGRMQLLEPNGPGHWAMCLLLF